MEAEKRINDSLPHYYRKSAVMQSAISAAANELDVLEADFADLKNELTVSGADASLERWEADYNLLPGEADIAERRRKILTAMRAGGTVTAETIRMLAETYFGRECAVTELYSQYTIIISCLNGVPESALTAFYKVARTIIPAHLAFTVRLEYNTWGDVAQYTWSQLANYTWDEVWKNKGGIA